MRSFYKSNKQYIFLFLIALVAYWQIGFLVNSLKWDMIDGFLPLRYFTAECLQNNIFPFWNPYQQCGFPIYANLICTWNPEVVITGYLFGYNNITLHVSLIFYIFLAGVGMYNLLMHFTNDSKTSFIIGVSYMLSGFFLGHTSHADYLSGGAWIPFVILNYIRLISKPSFKNILISILFLFLIITTGYPAISVILSYILLIIFIEAFLRNVINKEYKFLLKISLANIIILATLTILCFGMILSWIQVSPYVARFVRLPIESAMLNPFSPQSLISILYPFSTVGDTELFKTDLAFRNIYMGLFFPIIFVLSLVLKKNRIQWIFLLSGIFCLFLALGNSLPFREFAFHYIPLMDKFKCPAVFRIFTIFSLLVFSGIGLSNIINSHNRQKLIKYLSYGLLTILIVSVSFSIIKLISNNIIFLEPKDTIENTIKDSSIYSRIIIQAFIQITILIVFIILHYKKIIFKYWSLLIIIDLIISIQLNIYRTGVSHHPPLKIASHLKTQTKGFPIPSEHIISDNKSSACQFIPLWLNTNVYSKRISFDSYNALWFSGYRDLVSNYPELKDSIIKNKLLYFSDKVYPLSILDHLLDTISSKDIYINDTLFTGGINANKFKSSDDDSISFTGFNPNKIEANVYSSHKQVLTFLQSNYSGWRVFIDNNESEIFTSNKLFISTIIPEGYHNIKFEYINKPIKIAFYIEFLGLFIICILIFLVNYKGLSGKNKVRSRVISITSIFLLLIYIIAIKKPSYVKLQKKDYNDISNIINIRKINDLSIICNVDNYPLLKKKVENTIYKRVRFNKDISDIIQFVEQSESYNFGYIWSNSNNPLEVYEIIKDKYPRIIINEKLRNSRITIFNRDSLISENKNIWISRCNPNDAYWNVNSFQYDSNILCYKVDTNIKYGASFYLKSSDIINSYTNSVVNLKLKYKYIAETESYLVLQINDHARNKIYKSIPLSFFSDNTKEWSKAYLSYSLPKQKNNTIKAYIWNPNGNTIYFNDLSLKIEKTY